MFADNNESWIFCACLFVCLFGFLTSSSTTRLYRGRAPRQERLTILRAATHETELGDHDFCLSRSHYTDRFFVQSSVLTTALTSVGRCCKLGWVFFFVRLFMYDVACLPVVLV